MHGVVNHGRAKDADELDEPVELLFLAIALPHRHLLTCTSGLTSYQVCITVPSAPGCLRPLLEGHLDTQRVTAVARQCVEPNLNHLKSYPMSALA